VILGSLIDNIDLGLHKLNKVIPLIKPVYHPVLLVVGVDIHGDDLQSLYQPLLGLGLEIIGKLSHRIDVKVFY
jgi:hypothetical protein